LDDFRRVFRLLDNVAQLLFQPDVWLFLAGVPLFDCRDQSSSHHTSTPCA
jgi:hypothetical protein